MCPAKMVVLNRIPMGGREMGLNVQYTFFVSFRIEQRPRQLLGLNRMTLVRDGENWQENCKDCKGRLCSSIRTLTKPTNTRLSCSNFSNTFLPFLLFLSGLSWKGEGKNSHFWSHGGHRLPESLLQQLRLSQSNNCFNRRTKEKMMIIIIIQKGTKEGACVVIEGEISELYKATWLRPATNHPQNVNSTMPGE